MDKNAFEYAILAALYDKPLTTYQVKEMVGKCTIHNVQRGLAALMESGYVTNKVEAWSITDRGKMRVDAESAG